MRLVSFGSERALVELVVLVVLANSNHTRMNLERCQAVGHYVVLDDELKVEVWNQGVLYLV